MGRGGAESHAATHALLVAHIRSQGRLLDVLTTKCESLETDLETVSTRLEKLVEAFQEQSAKERKRRKKLKATVKALGEQMDNMRSAYHVSKETLIRIASTAVVEAKKQEMRRDAEKRKGENS
jgi:hypothetical protein